MKNNLITASGLAAFFDQKNLVVIDSSWHLPNQNRNPYNEYMAGHIKRAVFFDLDLESRRDTNIPHQALPAHLFQHSMRKLGINTDSLVVIYDVVGCFSAARLWFLLRAHQFHNVLVLDGGMPQWLAVAGAVETGVNNPVYGNYINKTNPTNILNKSQIDGFKGGIIDARSADRYHARVPEPRPNTRSGHIAGAGNIPYNVVLRENGTMRPANELQKIFADFDTSQPIAAYCGSGVTACVILLALAQLGINGNLYDGSWAEYGFMGG